MRIDKNTVYGQIVTSMVISDYLSFLFCNEFVFLYNYIKVKLCDILLLLNKNVSKIHQKNKGICE